MDLRIPAGWAWPRTSGSSSTFRRWGAPRAGSLGLRGTRGGEGVRDGPRASRGARRQGPQDEGECVSGLRLGGQWDRPEEFSRAGTRVLQQYRLPESTRQAHNAANRLRRGEEPGGTMRLL